MSLGFKLSSQQMAVIGRERALGRRLYAHATVEFDRGTPIEAIAEALAQLSLRHEILRTTYREIAGLPWPMQTIWPGPCYRLICDETVASEAGEGILLATLTFSGLRLVLRLQMPLASVDAISIGVLVKELRMLLAGTELSTPADKLDYADYSEWQNELLSTELGVQGLAFWRNAAAGAHGSVQLPFERIASSATTVGRTTVDAEALPASELLAFWMMFLARITEQEVVAVTVENDERPEEMTATLGRFVRRLPVSIRIERELSVRESLQIMQARLEECLSWKDCYRDADALPDAEKGPSVGFSVLTHRRAAIQLDELHSERLRLECEPGRWSLCWPEGRFDVTTVRTWLEQFVTFVRHARANLDQPLSDVSLLSESERERVLREFNPSAWTGEDQSTLLHHLFEQQVARTPEAIAVSMDDANISYAALNERATHVALALQAQGIGAEQIVGVHAHRSIEMIVGLLGVMKAGAAYLPLDPSYPPDRLAFIVRDAQVRCVLSTGGLAPQPGVQVMSLAASAEPCAGEVVAVAQPPNLAYVIYTSGSTGMPKGVLISHANAVASTRARAVFYEQPVGGFLLLSSFSFDSSVAGIFWTLSQGGTLHLPSEAQYKDARRVSELVNERPITHLLTLPSYYALMLERLQPRALSCVIVAGESCPGDLPARHYERFGAVALVNEYGPTEGTVWSNAWRIPPASRDRLIPIGAPIRTMQTYVLDSQLSPSAIGQSGEIYIAGAGIARGYLNRAGLTAERFLPNPWSALPGQRMYRTGDVGRHRADGAIEYLGRRDHQVKIRGYRIELGEIEARLRAVAQVQAAVVLAKEEAAERRLVGYVVPKDGATVTGEALRSQLLEVLPEYMVPSQWLMLASIPQTPNGKVDREALLKLQLQRREYVAPRDETERTLSEIWSEVLQVERVGVHDNFFELGGHSLLATEVASRIRQRLSIDVQLKTLFEAESLALLAQALSGHTTNATSAEQIDVMTELLEQMEKA